MYRVIGWGFSNGTKLTKQLVLLFALTKTTELERGLDFKEVGFDPPGGTRTFLQPCRRFLQG